MLWKFFDYMSSAACQILNNILAMRTPKSKDDAWPVQQLIVEHAAVAIPKITSNSTIYLHEILVSKIFSVNICQLRSQQNLIFLHSFVKFWSSLIFSTEANSQQKPPYFLAGNAHFALFTNIIHIFQEFEFVLIVPV